MKLHIDWTRCDGHGTCVELLPEVLTTDDWGFPLAKSGEKQPHIPAALLDHADRAVRVCPLMALQLVPDEPRGQSRARATSYTS